MDYFSNRLRDERKRLNLSQEEFAALGGVKKGAQFNYENGSRSPDAEYLMAIAKAGVDIQFLLTGTPAVDKLGEEESQLLAGYHRLDEKNKTRLLGLVDGMLAANPDSR